MPRDDNKEIERLLKVLEEREDKRSEDQTDTYTFLEFYKIHPGKYKVKTSALYALYIQWSSEPIDKHQFSKQLGLYLDTRSDKYLINREPLKQLLPLIITKKKNNKKSYKNTHLFFMNMGWTKGNNFYPAFILYYLVKKWSKKNKKVAPSRHAFYLMLSLQFPKKKISHHHIEYGINQQLNITPHKMRAIKSIVYGKKKKK